LKLILYPFLVNNSIYFFGTVPCLCRKLGLNSENTKGTWYLLISSIASSITIPSPLSISSFIKAIFLFDN